MQHLFLVLDVQVHSCSINAFSIDEKHRAFDAGLAG